MDSAAPQPQQPSAADDDETRRRRRSTDCIYYLASPLTCKKGSECEYRHSDAARMNPRDCWYWFNGNCTNPKCSFRHPPLDDLLGAPANPRASQQAGSQVPVPAQAPGSIPASSTAKPGVPCYYFQKGMCAKGNMCAFSHVPQVAGNPALQQSAKVFAPALQPQPQLKNSNSWIKPHNSAQQNTTRTAHDELNVSAHNGKPAQKQNLTSRAYHSSGIYQNHNNSYLLSGATKSYQAQPSVEDDSAENVMETGEFVREPSAGSSVLVGSVDEDAERSFKEDHSSYPHTSLEKNTGMHRQTHGGYELERPHRSSANRLLSEGRLSQREPLPATADSSDLRHRLLKQRRLNNPKTTQVPDKQDSYHEEERHNHHRRREEEQATHNGFSRSRLHGRIKLPGESSLDRLGAHPEKERGPRARLSPPRQRDLRGLSPPKQRDSRGLSPPKQRDRRGLSPPKQTDLRGKLHDRLKARSNEDVPGHVRSSVVKANSDEDAGSLNFSGPKSLAELRAKKVASSSREHTLKSADPRIAEPVRMTSEIVANRDSPYPVPFDSPKPLSDILKRKREAASADSGSIQEEQAAGEEEESLNKYRAIEDDLVVTNTKGKEEEAFHPEDNVMYDDSLSPADNNAAGDAGKEELEPEQDLETAEEEYDYEANAEDDNDYQEYEDDDDLEDDDDFARKVGVLIS